MLNSGKKCCALCDKINKYSLDEKLNFVQHILNIERKAGNSLGMLRRQGTVASICPPPFFISKAVW
jgi:hypothetical protein